MQAQIGLMVEGQMGLNWPRWKRVLEVAERAGFQSVFMSDHFVDPEPPDQDQIELWVALTYAAATTRRIEIGPLVAPVTFRHQTMTIRQAAAVDALSEGRLVLGLGAGWQEREHRNYGIPFYDMRTRFELLTDALEIARRLYADAEPVTYTGKQVRVEDAVLLPRPLRNTPILIGGNGPKRTLPLAARYADEWNGVFIDAEAFGKLNRRLTELIEAEGRDPAAVKRSMMIPFEWVEGEKAQSCLTRFVEAGCERFMIQYVDYDNLEPIEQWANEVLPKFHG